MTSQNVESRYVHHFVGITVHRAATTNHITAGEGGGQAGQRVAYGCRRERTWLE